MNIVIIEDEVLSQNLLSHILKSNNPDIKIIKVIDSVKESIDFLENNDVDLIFMDINLKDGDCFEIFEKIEINIPIIFITAHDTYSIKAFDVNGISYILKPISEDKISKAIDKYNRMKNISLDKKNIENLLSSINSEPKYRERILVRIGDRIIVIDELNIAYFISESKTSFVCTKENNIYELDSSLDSLSTKLNPNNFFRISRNLIVRFDSIDNISKFPKGSLKVSLLCEPQKEIVISQDRASEFYNWIIGEKRI